jgi:hypothetical protein
LSFPRSEYVDSIESMYQKFNDQLAYEERAALTWMMDIGRAGGRSWGRQLRTASAMIAQLQASTPNLLRLGVLAIRGANWGLGECPRKLILVARWPRSGRSEGPITSDESPKVAA